MNRRHFLRALGGGIAALTVPLPSIRPRPTLDAGSKLLYMQLYRTGFINAHEFADALGIPLKYYSCSITFTAQEIRELRNRLNWTSEARQLAKQFLEEGK